MRKIKFRAWKKDEKIMCYSFQWNEYFNNPHMAGGNHCSVLYSKRQDRYLQTRGESFTNNFIIEQFTGIRDKNGKEIYEGDILSGGQELMIVEYKNELASFVLRGLKNGYIYKISSFIDTLEIIGNIHENPELLEPENA